MKLSSWSQYLCHVPGEPRGSSALALRRSFQNAVGVLHARFQISPGRYNLLSRPETMAASIPNRNRLAKFPCRPWEVDHGATSR